MEEGLEVPKLEGSEPRANDNSDSTHPSDHVDDALPRLVQLIDTAATDGWEDRRRG